MKSIKYFSISFVLLISMSLYAQKSQAQNVQAQATSILTKVEAKYKNAKAIRAKFSYEMVNTVKGIKDQVDGSFVMKKNKYRLRLLNQEIINNGKTMWTYIKESNEVNITDYNPNSEDITPEKVFSLYKKDYKAVYAGEETQNGKVYQIVDLQPNDHTKKHFKIRIKINKKFNSIKSWEIFEKNQNRFKYTISMIEYNIAVGDGYFSFNEKKYPNVEIIDLR